MGSEGDTRAEEAGKARQVGEAKLPAVKTVKTGETGETAETGKTGEEC